MHNTKDETGNTYGRLTVLREAPSPDGKAEKWWWVRCTCNTEKAVRGTRLRNGNTVSCGCKRAEGQGAVTHGGTVGENFHPFYRLWTSIKVRTTCETNREYPAYGGRGIRIHESWQKDFAAFRDWMQDNLGDRPPGMSLDRINPDGHYEPGNLRWADDLTQARNKSGSRARVLQLQTERDDLAALVLRLMGHDGNQARGHQARPA